jgi:hypothetical protein
VDSSTGRPAPVSPSAELTVASLGAARRE